MDGMRRKAVDAPDESDETAAERAYAAIQPMYGLAPWRTLDAAERAVWIATVASVRAPIRQSRDLWKGAARRLNADARRAERYGHEGSP